jgi:hypothetical protein
MEQRVVLRHQVAQPELRQTGGGDAEELLRRLIGVAEMIAGIEQHHRHRQRTEQLRRVGRRPTARLHVHDSAPQRIDHAAHRAGSPVRPAASSASSSPRPGGTRLAPRSISLS